MSEDTGGATTVVLPGRRPPARAGNQRDGPAPLTGAPLRTDTRTSHPTVSKPLMPAKFSPIRAQLRGQGPLRQRGYEPRFPVPQLIVNHQHANSLRGIQGGAVVGLASHWLA